MTPKLAHTLDSLANEFQYDPSGRWGVETVGPIREAARIIAALEKQPAASGEPFPPEDPVTVPRGLLGAACAAIERKHDTPKTLAALRRYTVGDLSATAQPAPAPAADPDECSANSNGHSFSPCGPRGRRQCVWCGEAPKAQPAPALVPLTDEQAMEIAVTATPPGSMASRHQIVEAIRLAERHHGIFPSKENPPVKSTYLTFSLFYDDIEFRVSGTYTPPDPGQTSGPPEKCWPPEPDAFETDDLMIGDVEVSLVIAPPILEKLDEMAREKAAEIYFNQKDF